ncbi:Retrovirus-related Pol polyprotein from transposon RE1 [Bienertia sinuspersici]
MSLGAKKKQGFIDGTCKRPQPSSKEYSKWLRCDYMVRCWLFKLMSDKIAESLMLCESAKQIWDEIYERYGQSNAPQLYQLKKDLSKVE